MRPDFAVFILTHNRPDSQRTLAALKKNGYGGKVFLVVDDADPDLDQYQAAYGDILLTFIKEDYDRAFDLCDNFEGRQSIVWARNACFDLARQIGVRYFIQLDDDYNWFAVRGRHQIQTTNLDVLLEAMVGFMETTPTTSLAMSQGGDHIGGFDGKVTMSRKAMNSFICDTERPFRFDSRFNDDVSTYVGLGKTGRLFFTITNVQLDHSDTQSQPGGLTEAYLESGTYVKSFYSVMASPSCVTVRSMGVNHQRLHHAIAWKHAVPMILHERHKKAA